MPIVTTVTVSKEISSLLFNANDTLAVTLNATSSDGAVTSAVHVLQADVVVPMLDSPPPAGYTMRQAIIAKVYLALLALGLVEGEITAG